ncbi:MAG: hypothetical protein Q9201_001342 [Fulgogasparrea decipioides]
MAGASDKARFYLEQSVPELQELLRKKLFSKDEVNSIVKKRSGFEHKLNARGSTASDYARYAEYEMNLDTLRRTRARRLGVKATNYIGHRRIFFILDRATRKFHGDTALWLQYLTFARKQKSNKKVSQIITNMLRLHPTSPDLWIYAANYSLDERGDITEARGYMQRGLRFCRRAKHLWSAYLRLEMIHIAKISARRQILGLDAISAKNDRSLDGGIGGDMVALPRITMEDMDSKHHKANSAHQTILNGEISSTPAFAGAIPIAVFAAAMEEFPNDAIFGAQLFDSVAEFQSLQSTRKILEHIVEVLMTTAPTSAESLRCFIHEPLVGVDVSSTELPGALIKVLDRLDLTMRKLDSLKDPLAQTQTRGNVSRHIVQWILRYLEAPELDSDIRAVLTTLLHTTWDHYLSSIQLNTEQSSDDMAALLDMLHVHGFSRLVHLGLTSALQKWPKEPRLLSLIAANS